MIQSETKRKFGHCIRLIGLSLLALLPANPAVFAQSSHFNPYFEEFTLPGGELANQVQCIIQDKVGFLWFASRSGLIRYDGRQFVTYRYNPLDSNSIASDYINWIFQDSRGLLWLGHANEGITVFDPVSEKSIRYRHLNKHPDTERYTYVSMIAEDRQGMIWVASVWGLYRIEPPAGKLQRGRIKHYPLSRRKAGTYDFVRSLLVDRTGTLWAGCGNPYGPVGDGGLYRYNPEKDAFVSCIYTGNQPEDDRVQFLFEDIKGIIWTGTCGKNGLYRVENNNQHIRFLRHGGPALQRNAHLMPQYEHMRFMFEDQQGRLWSGAVEGGLDVYDPKSRQTWHFEKEADKPGSLQVISIWYGYPARDGSVWLACGDNGPVYRVKNTNELFSFYNLREILGIEDVAVAGIAEGHDGKLWIQFTGEINGIVHLDRESLQAKRYGYSPQVQNSPHWHLFRLSIDRQNKIWAGTENGLYFLDPADNERKVFQPDARFAAKMKTGQSWTPYEDSRGRTWIPSYGNGLYRFDPGREDPVHSFYQKNDTLGIGSNYVVGVFEDSRGALWVYGHREGFSNDLLERIRPGPRDTFEHNLFNAAGNLSALAEDKEGNFWCPVKFEGVWKVNPLTGASKLFTINNSTLPSSDIDEILAGSDGNIWMSSKGLFTRLDPEQETFFAFPTYLIDEALHRYTAACQGRSGELFFGGKDGFFAFDPRKLREKTEKYPARPVLTSLRVLGERVVPGDTSFLHRPLWVCDELRLTHQQNAFTLQLSVFEFGEPERSKVEYILENYDRKWRDDLRDGEAAYVNVPPGSYVFRVRGLNSIGNPLQEYSLRIIVLPPWWQTWWARAIFALLAATGLYALSRFQLGRRLAQAEAIRLRELDSVKTRLYTNVTHEFRTPLTLLIGPVERALKEKEMDGDLRNVLQTVLHNSWRLLNLVNQMLDLAKLESEKVSLHPVQGDMAAYLRYLVESFHSMAADKNIQIHFLTALESLNMDFDEERMRQIYSNLLANALKFTPEDGDVYIDLQLEKPKDAQDHSAETAVLRIRDTGIGIPEDQLPFIFDRFYQVDDTTTQPWEGTGIGLALTKELVKLMGGNIRVYSRPRWGTEFTIALPVTRLAEKGLSSKAAPASMLWSNFSKPALPAMLATDEAKARAPLVLLVEDNTDVIAYLASCLPDYRLATARNGQEGLEIAAEITPDILISDVMMPRMNGFQMCRALKTDARTSHIPVILLTAKADHRSKIEGLEQGAEAYMVKPFHQEELQMLVRKMLENRQRLQAYYRQVVGLDDSAIQSNDQPALRDLDHTFVQQARAEVVAQLENPDLDVDLLCRKLAMSRSQLHRKLTALTGLSTLNFIRSIRLNHAKELLLDPTLSITAIAFECGFNDPDYFGRVFKQTFGLTPKIWREQQRPA